MAYLKEGVDNPVVRAIDAVEKCMEENGVSVYKAMGGEIVLSLLNMGIRK